MLLRETVTPRAYQITKYQAQSVAVRKIGVWGTIQVPSCKLSQKLRSVRQVRVPNVQLRHFSPCLEPSIAVKQAACFEVVVEVPGQFAKIEIVGEKT
jgi:hypothetical protein